MTMWRVGSIGFCVTQNKAIKTLLNDVKGKSTYGHVMGAVFIMLLNINLKIPGGTELY